MAWLQGQGLRIDKLSPLPLMYAESSSFGKARVLVAEDDYLKRQSAPTAPYCANGYAFVMLSLFERHFPMTKQVTAKQFNEATRFFSIAHWSERAQQEVLDELASRGAFRVERQLEDAVLTPLCSSDTYLSSIYDELP